MASNHRLRWPGVGLKYPSMRYQEGAGICWHERAWGGVSRDALVWTAVGRRWGRQAGPGYRELVWTGMGWHGLSWAGLVDRRLDMGMGMAV